MPTEEEEAAKILLCGAAVNYANAKAACATMESTLEMDNLVRFLIPNLEGDAKKYYDQVKRRAEKIMDLSREIMALAAAFNGE